MTKPLHVVSPILRSPSLSERLGYNAFIKLDNVQPSGSFKIRGIGHLAQHACLQGKTALISSSGGNAGMAVACAAQSLGMECKVVVPQSTPEYMCNKLRKLGAEVSVFGAAWDEADTLAREMVEKNPSAQYMPPFDHPKIWEGHASMIKEIIDNKQLDQPPAAVVLSVGGGGLLCGVAEGMQQVGWNKIPIITAETIGANSFHESVKAKQLVTLPAITSVAKSLGAKTVAPKCMELVETMNVIPMTVTDDEAVEACINFEEEHRMLVEPACGATLALCKKGKEIAAALQTSEELLKEQGILFIVCGGNAVSSQGLRDTLDSLKSN